MSRTSPNMTPELIRRIEQAERETQRLIDKAMSYLPENRKQEVISAYQKHLRYLADLKAGKAELKYQNPYGSFSQGGHYPFTKKGERMIESIEASGADPGIAVATTYARAKEHGGTGLVQKKWASEHGYPKPNPALTPMHTTPHPALPFVVRYVIVIDNPHLRSVGQLQPEPGTVQYWERRFFDQKGAVALYKDILSGGEDFGSEYVRWVDVVNDKGTGNLSTAKTVRKKMSRDSREEPFRAENPSPQKVLVKQHRKPDRVIMATYGSDREWYDASGAPVEVGGAYVDEILEPERNPAGYTTEKYADGKFFVRAVDEDNEYQVRIGDITGGGSSWHASAGRFDLGYFKTKKAAAEAVFDHHEALRGHAEQAAQRRYRKKSRKQFVFPTREQANSFRDALKADRNIRLTGRIDVRPSLKEHRHGGSPGTSVFFTGLGLMDTSAAVGLARSMGGRGWGDRKNPALTYGVMPPRAEFANVVAPNLPFYAELKGTDKKAAEAVGYEGERIDDPNELYDVIQALIHEWEEGDEDAGDLASGFMDASGFRWI